MIRTETNLEACRHLWQQFAPGNSVWDDWGLMYAFHDPDRHELQFMVHMDTNGQADGLIPLVRDTANDRHMLMAGSYPDGRILWLDYRHIPECFERLPHRTVLFDLDANWVDGLIAAHPHLAPQATERDRRWFLVPAKFDYDFNRHLDSFPTEKRQKFNYDLRNVRKRDPVLFWSEDDESDLFISLVNANFGAESDYASEEGASELRRVVAELRQSGRLRTLVIAIAGKKEAVSMSLLHGDKMVALYSAGNGQINNLGKLINVETINEACRLHLDEISFMTGMKWKADWKMDSDGCVTLRKPAAPWPEHIPPAG